MGRTSVKPPIEVIAGPAHSAKTARVISAFRESIEEGAEAVLILPTAQAARSLRTELLLDGTFGFLGGPCLLTFVEFARQVLVSHAPEVQPIDPMTQDELLARIIAELAESGEMTYHTRVLDFGGFVRAVRAFLMELKRAEITPDDFARFARRKAAGSKDRELSAVYSRYQQTLRELNLYDEEGRFWRAKLLVSEGKPGPFASLRRLFLDGFYDFTPTQLGLVEALARRGVEVTMSLPLEEGAGRRELFESAEATLERLRERFEPTVQLLPVKEVAEPALAWLNAHLFRSGPPADAPQPDAVHLIETPGAVAEVREIAREIKRLHLEEGIPLERVAVVFRTLAEYRDIVREVFDEFGIPVRIGRGVSLSHTPVGLLFLHLLRVPAEGWHSHLVMSLLKSTYVSTSALGLDDELTVARFEELVGEAGVIHGQSSWLRNLRALRERVASRMDSAGVDLDDEVRLRLDRAELEEKHRDLVLAESVCEKLFELFAGLEKADTIDGLVEAVSDVAGRLGVKENITGAGGGGLAAADLESLAGVRDCLMSLVRTAAVVGGAQCSLPAFLKNVKLAFSDMTVGLHSADFGRVQVCEVHDIRALVFDAVFIGGLLERSFPRMHREEPFYDDYQRARMNEEGLNIHPRRLNQREERFLFYLAATRATRGLYLSYPVTDREGKEKLVSYYVGEVRRLFAPHELPCRKVTLSTKVVGVEESSSRQELRRAAVLELSEPGVSKERLAACGSALLALTEPRTVEVLRRGLEGEAERDSWETFGLHDGVLSHAEAVATLAQRFGADHDFSVTALETYGGCPFAFFCRWVLGIEAPAEPLEELEPVDEGIILHRTLREFYSERCRRAGDARIGEDEIGSASARIREIAEGHLDRFHRRNPDLNEGLFNLQREGIRELLAEFVAAEVALREKDAFDMLPGHFEVAFGLPVNRRTADRLSNPNRLVIDVEGGEPVRIVGKIDRIDLTESPMSEGGVRGFRIIDYKRGSAPVRPGDIEEGTALQMPVYLLAARDVMFADETFRPVDARFYGLRDMKPRPIVVLLRRTKAGIEPVAGADELMETAVGFIRDYVRAIRRGEFPVLRRGRGGCPNYCEFREICRYSEWRARKKLGETKPWFAHRARGAHDEARTDE